jgi:TolB-like protein
MKLFFIFIATVFTLTGCESSPQGADAPEDLSGAGSSETEQAPYTGDGGAGKSITILPLNVKGLAKDQSNLPDTMLGEFISNFSNYSAMSVLDRINLQTNYEWLYSGIIDDNSEELDWGHLPPTDYLMNGSITKIPSGYALQIQISKTSDKMLAAPAYSGTCTIYELTNFTAIRRASRDQLEKLGVKLTDWAKRELDGAATQQAVEAQEALSKGIEAMRKGTVVEAQSYFIQAQAIDPQLAEAASRVNIVSRDISSGNIGENARNRQAWHDEWQKRLAECEKTVRDYMKNTPLPAFLVYSTAIKEENHDYNRATLTLSCGDIALYTASESWPAPAMGVVDAVYAGLKATGQAAAWGFGNWPNYSAALGEKIPRYETVVELVNDKGAVIGKQSVTLSAGWNISFNNGRAKARKSESSAALRFNNVDANKISDRLSVRIASLNGVDAEKAAQAGSVSIITIDEYKKTPAYFVAQNCEFKDGVLTKCTGDLKVLDGVIPAWFNGQAVTGIDEGVFIFKGRRYLGQEYKSGRTRAVVPNSVTSIGAGAFAEEEGVNNLGFIPLYNLYLISQEKANYFEYPDNFSVSLPANIDFGHRQGFEDSLADFYNGNGRKAGTCTWDGAAWRYSARR